MKYKIQSDEGEMIFLHNLYDGNVYVTNDKFQVDRNIKRLKITNDFTKNTRMTMIRDIVKDENIVVITHRAEDNHDEKIQILIDGDSKFEDIHDNLKPLLEQAFRIRDASSLGGLLGMTDEETNQ